MTDVLSIVEEFLRREGYDGLYNTDGGCACLIDDLEPCGCMGSNCRSGYKNEGCTPECGEGCSFHVERRRNSES